MLVSGLIDLATRKSSAWKYFDIISSLNLCNSHETKQVWCPIICALNIKKKTYTTNRLSSTHLMEVCGQWTHFLEIKKYKSWMWKLQPMSLCVIMSCCQHTLLVTLYSICRNLSAIQDREICCYSVSCKEKDNIGKHKVSIHSLPVGLIE